MARTIKEIQSEIATAMKAEFAELSSSAVATWRLIAHVVAVSIYTFEIILDRFKIEMEAKTRQITPATERWYAEMSRRFQNGHELTFDEKTAMYYYKTNDPNSRIAAIVAVKDRNKVLAIKVAKLNEGKIQPFDADELQNFTGYIRTIHVVGTQYSIISTTPDMLKYNIEVFYDPIQPKTNIETRVKVALEAFKSEIGFDGTLYSQRLVDAIMHSPGVMTVNAVSIKRKGATQTEFVDTGAWCELHAGYFDYDSDCVLTLTPML